ncbi:MAG: phage tail assembly protein [Alphaproteobacteria bacterium]|nr:phage tail assembly protein [Alphaproteobacteria bacterium]
MTIKMNPDEPFTLVFKEKITHATVDYSQLVLTEPTVDQVDQAAKKSGGISSNATLIALVAKVPEQVVRKMSYRDFTMAMRYLDLFLADGGQTGAIFSPS